MRTFTRENLTDILFRESSIDKLEQFEEELSKCDNVDLTESGDYGSLPLSVNQFRVFIKALKNAAINSVEFYKVYTENIGGGLAGILRGNKNIKHLKCFDCFMQAKHIEKISYFLAEYNKTLLSLEVVSDPEYEQQTFTGKTKDFIPIIIEYLNKNQTLLNIKFDQEKGLTDSLTDKINEVIKRNRDGFELKCKEILENKNKADLEQMVDNIKFILENPVHFEGMDFELFGKVAELCSKIGQQRNINCIFSNQVFNARNTLLSVTAVALTAVVICQTNLVSWMYDYISSSIIEIPKVVINAGMNALQYAYNVSSNIGLGF